MNFFSKKTIVIIGLPDRIAEAIQNFFKNAEPGYFIHVFGSNEFEVSGAEDIFSRCDMALFNPEVCPWYGRASGEPELGIKIISRWRRRGFDIPLFAIINTDGQQLKELLDAGATKVMGNNPHTIANSVRLYFMTTHRRHQRAA